MISESSGSSTSSFDPWTAFVQSAIGLTIDAYNRFMQKHISVQGWDEDTISWNLWDCMRQVRRGRDIDWDVSYQYHVPTDVLLEGQQRAKSAKKIDLKLADYYEDDKEQYFAWEAKKLENKPPSDDRTLSNKYISDGMTRFIEGEYSPEVTYAGMLGYILHGRQSAIVAQINEIITELGWQHSSTLQPYDLIDRSNVVYLSTHERTTINSPINLHHLLLQFDF